jgi:hypothetical protein
MLLVPNTDTASAIAKVGLDPANQRYYLFDKQNQVLKTDTLTSTEVARFLSVDPLTKSYPWYTPYQFAGNKPIWAIDVDGLEETGYTRYLDRQLSTVEGAREVQKDRGAKAIMMGGALVVATAPWTVPYIGEFLAASSARLYFLAATNHQLVIGTTGLAASIIDPNPNDDYPGGLDDVVRGTKLLFKSGKVEKFLLNSSKFEYFFGKVTSGKHNSERTIQNMKDLASLGIKDDKAGKEKLASLFEEGLSGPVTKSLTNEYGTTIVRRVEVNAGDVKGALDVSYFYEGGNMLATPEVKTIIPKIFTK